MSAANLARHVEPQSAGDALRELAAFADAQQRDVWDVYGEGEWLQAFEADVAAAVGKPAAIFFPSGVGAQMAALAVYCARRERRAVALHDSSHLLLHEFDAHDALLGVARDPLGEPDRPAGAADVAAAVGAAPAAVFLEVPHRELGGATTSLDDLRACGEAARGAGVPLHMDGARLWDVQPHFGCSLAELAAPFDSVYVSFYKGLGAVTGAMLLGAADFVAEARVWRKRLGGGVFRQAPYALSCRLGWETRLAGLAARHAKLVEVAAALTAAHGAALRFQPPVPTCTHVHLYVLHDDADAVEAAARATAEEDGVVVIDRLRGRGPVYMEFKMGPANVGIPTETYVEGWGKLLGRLVGPQ